MKAIKRLEEDVQCHGEVHAVIEEPGTGEFSGEELEIRLGTAEFDYEAGFVTIEGGDTLHRVMMDSIIRWYLPVEPTHG